jgi:hypothetical protein
VRGLGRRDGAELLEDLGGGGVLSAAREQAREGVERDGGPERGGAAVIGDGAGDVVELLLGEQGRPVPELGRLGGAFGGAPGVARVGGAALGLGEGRLALPKLDELDEEAARGEELTELVDRGGVPGLFGEVLAEGRDGFIELPLGREEEREIEAQLDPRRGALGDLDLAPAHRDEIGRAARLLVERLELGGDAPVGRLLVEEAFVEGDGGLGVGHLGGLDAEPLPLARRERERRAAQAELHHAGSVALLEGEAHEDIERPERLGGRLTGAGDLHRDLEETLGRALGEGPRPDRGPSRQPRGGARARRA